VTPHYTIRPARPQDVPAIVAMVHELAEYERAPERCRLTDDRLRAALFATRPAVFGHIALDAGSGEPLAMMLWFLNFSTWEGGHGIYLEDLYVRPAARGLGLGRAMLATLADVCVRRGYERLDWSVLDWNPAREFYAAIGAGPIDDWVPYRLTGRGLTALAATAGSAAPAEGEAEPHDVASTP
jgi:GNAT superfamily N-acetyltransferase